MIDHDRLFKELLSTFFLEFLVAFESEIGRIKPEAQEEVMQIVTSWMEEGIERGRKEGRNRETELVLRMLSVKFGSLDSEIEKQIRELEINRLEDLGVALLSFQQVRDLELWLQNGSENSSERS